MISYMVSGFLAPTFLAVLLFVVHCDTPIDERDADFDGDTDPDADADLESNHPAPPEPPAMPVLTPCPEGLRQVAADPPEGLIDICDPWPETGREQCGSDEAHFPGASGCQLIGTECPAGEWPEGLPENRDVYFVRAGAPAGGDGTKSSPFGTIAQAMNITQPGDVIALGKGIFEEAVRLRGGVTLWGTCVAETRIEAPDPDQYSGAITVVGRDAEIGNLQIGGERAGIWVDTMSVHIEGVLVNEAQGMGIVVIFGGEATGRSIAIRGTNLSAPQTGFGLYVTESGRAEFDQIVIEENSMIGVAVTQEGSHLRLSRAHIANTKEVPGQGLGRGIDLLYSAELELEASVVEGNHEVGVRSFESSAIITDTVIKGTISRSRDGRLGWGLEVAEGGYVEICRAHFRKNHDVAVVAAGGSELVMEDSLIAETEPDSSDYSGLGLMVDFEGRAQLTRVAFASNHTTGILAQGSGTSGELEDVTIIDTQSDLIFGDWGRALESNSGAVLSGNRLLMERNRDVGVIAADQGTTIRLENAVIKDTQERGCASDQCSDFPGGFGVVSINDALIKLSRFAVTGNPGCGLQLVGAEIELSEGEVSHSRIGVNVQDETFDVQRLMDRVVYENNGANLDISDLPVPELRDSI